MMIIDSVCYRNIKLLLMHILVASSSDMKFQPFEKFDAGKCRDGTDDITMLNTSSYVCVNECRARVNCVSVSVHNAAKLCRLNMAMSSIETCTDFMCSQKSTWIKKEITECLSLVCTAGYKCDEDIITGTAFCIVAECSLSSIANGVILGTERAVGSIIYHKCDAGYKLEGSRTRTCLQSGEWSGSLIKCVLLECQTGWDLFQGNCYLFGNGQAMNFSASVIYCESLGATMLHVQTMDENTYVFDHVVIGQRSGYWAGLTDVDLEGTWTWYSTGEIPVVPFWNPPEPDRGTDENCAVYHKGHGYKWADVDCSRSYQLICMMPLI